MVDLIANDSVACPLADAPGKFEATKQSKTATALASEHATSATPPYLVLPGKVGRWY